MNYPLISEYAEAIRSAENNLDKLSKFRPILDNNGNPVMANGDFSVVFKMEDTETGKLYAVKCFTDEQEERTERYSEIIRELEKVHSSYIVSTQYLEKELFVDTKQSEETKFPVVVMDWVEGESLDVYLKSIEDNKPKRELLAKNFQEFVCWLLPQPFAHGDLEPDNILVKEDGGIVLVDYDGMFVPSLYGEFPSEFGVTFFQYKGRTLSDFNEYIDDYAAVLILLILKINAISAVNFDDTLYDISTDFIKKAEAYLTEKSIAPLLSAYIMVSTFGRIDRRQVYCLLADNANFDYKKETMLIAEARKGSTVAMIKLGDLYRKGISVPKDYAKAIQWYELAKQLGNADAICDLCHCYLDDSNSPEHTMLLDYRWKQTFSHCKQAEKYYFGLKVKADREKAIHLWEQAAKEGNAGASYWLSICFTQEKNLNKAIYWCQKAADAGYSSAQNKLGEHYMKGEGIEKDLDKAVYWFQKAANNGNAHAQYYLGECYEMGYGVEKDLNEAVFWYQEAANAGEPLAVSKLSTSQTHEIS